MGGNVGAGEILHVNGIGQIGAVDEELLMGGVSYSGFAGIKHKGLNVNSYALIQNSAGKTILNCAQSQNIHFHRNNADEMVMDGGGLGIKNSNPTRPLDVTGDAVIRGTLTTDVLEIAPPQNALPGTAGYLVVSSNENLNTPSNQLVNWAGPIGNTTHFTGPNNGNTFTCKKTGWYSISCNLTALAGSTDKRMYFFAYIEKQINSGGGEKRYYFGSAYYRDNNDALDDMAMAGTVMVHLKGDDKYATNIAERFRVVVVRFMKEGSHTGTLLLDPGLSRLYVEYMGISTWVAPADFT